MCTIDARDAVGTPSVVRRDGNRDTQLPARLFSLRFYNPYRTGDGGMGVVRHPRFKSSRSIALLLFTTRVLCLIGTKLSLLHGSAGVERKLLFLSIPFFPLCKSRARPSLSLSGIFDRRLLYDGHDAFRAIGFKTVFGRPFRVFRRRYVVVTVIRYNRV